MATAAAEPLFDPNADYVPSDEVAGVAAALLKRHRAIRELVEDLRIAYLVRLGEPSGEGEEAIAKCQKASPLWRDLAGYDVVIWVWDYWWSGFEARQREAVVLHELCHVGRTAKGGVKLRTHDVEEFMYVVRHYGAWDDFGHLADFDRAMQQHAVDQTKTEGGLQPVRLPAGRERRRKPDRSAKPNGGVTPAGGIVP